MFNRKFAALAFAAIVSAPSAFAADVITSDGRAGGAFWGQPITSSATTASLPRAALTIGEIDPSDGRLGGAYWGSARVAKKAVETHAATNAAGKRFVATAQIGQARPFAFLEDFNN